MREDVRSSMCDNVFVNMCVSVCLLNMRVHMCVSMRVRHVCRHLCRDACRHVYVDLFVCLRASSCYFQSPGTCRCEALCVPQTVGYLCFCSGVPSWHNPSGSDCHAHGTRRGRRASTAHKRT